MMHYDAHIKFSLLVVDERINFRCIFFGKFYDSWKPIDDEFITYHLLLITYHLSLITYYLLLITYHLSLRQIIYEC